jgi:phosphopantothenoylcysteine decarboxylase/phosphopantothenate--cysteine ligase
MKIFEGKHILLGVTGSIAGYKAADLASKLAQSGAVVDVILTQSAQEFVTPLTFQSVTGRQAYTDKDLWGTRGHVVHIDLGRQADLLVIAPATANTIARLAGGIADNLLCVTALAAACPLLIAPAMDGGMYRHPATQANVERLRSQGVLFAGPASGHLASGQTGEGRLLEPAELFGHVRLALARSGRLAGRKIVVTAGGTQEPIDPVRVISNRSSGKQGFALAQAALDMGARVTLITAPVCLETPIGADRIDIQTAAEMKAAVLSAAKDADILVMAAAVADFRPAAPADDKLKKEQGIPTLVLEKTDDILAALAEAKTTSGYPLVTVGFAAESSRLTENAARKLRTKRLDLIVANDISAKDAGFSSTENRVTLLGPDGAQQDLPLMSKTSVAEIVLEQAADRLPGA